MDVSRQARSDLGGLTAVQVREILELARRPIAIEISRLKHALRRCTSLDADDLQSLGQIAAIEAAKAYNPERGVALRSWIGTCVRWRLAEVMKDAGDQASREVSLGLARDLEIKLVEQPSTEPRRGLRVRDEEALVSSETISETVARQQTREWVLRSLSGLTPRQKILLVQRLANSEESDAEIAKSFGIDRSLVWRDFSAAVAVLRQRVCDEIVPMGGAACV